MGSAPICCDCDFTIGSVRTRDGIQGVYTFAGGDEIRQAGTGQNVTPPAGVAWLNPSHITLNSPPIYATVALQSPNLTSEFLETSNYGFTIPNNAQILGIEIDISGQRVGISSPTTPS